MSPDSFSCERVEPNEVPRKILRNPHDRVRPDTGNQPCRSAGRKPGRGDRTAVEKPKHFRRLVAFVNQDDPLVITDQRRVGVDACPLPDDLARVQATDDQRRPLAINDVLAGHEVQGSNRATVAIVQPEDSELASLRHQKDRTMLSIRKAVAPQLRRTRAGNIKHDKLTADADGNGVPGTQQ